MCPTGSSQFAVDAMDSLCVDRLDMVIHSFSELVQTGVPPGPLTDTTVKVCVCACKWARFTLSTHASSASCGPNSCQFDPTSIAPAAGNESVQSSEGCHEAGV